MTTTLARILSICSLLPLAAAAQSEPSTAQFFEGSTVHDIRITLPEKAWDEVCSESRNMAESLTLSPSRSPYHYARGEVVIDGIRVADVGIRKKGFLGSQDPERPSLKISFDKFSKGRTFAGLDRLTLNNNKQDRSLLSQYLTYESFREVGLPAPRVSFAHVFVNGVDLGVYTNVESAGATMLQNCFGDDSGQLYEGTVVDFIPDRVVRFERKNGSSGEKRGAELLARVAELLKTSDVDLDELNECVDIDAFMKFWAMESLIGFWDGYCGNQNNYFIYRHPADSRLRFIPWGADVAFGKGLIAQIFKAGRPECVAAFALLPNRLYQDEATRDRYYATLDSLLETYWNEERLIAETHRLEDLLGAHVNEDQKDHRKAAEAMRRFIKSRRAELAKELSDGPPEVKFNERSTVCSTLVGTLEGTFATVWEPEERQESKGTRLVLTRDGEQIELSKVKLAAKPGPGAPFSGLAPGEPVIRIKGVRSDNKKPVEISLLVRNDVFRPGLKHPATAHGTYIEGEQGFFKYPTELSVGGKVVFTSASREDGAVVEGTLRLRLLKMDDGHKRRKRKPSSGK